MATICMFWKYNTDCKALKLACFIIYSTSGKSTVAYLHVIDAFTYVNFIRRNKILVAEDTI